MLVGTVVAVMLWLLEVQMPHVFGLITFALNFVPNLGPLIATFLPMPLVIFDPGKNPHMPEVGMGSLTSVSVCRCGCI